MSTQIGAYTISRQVIVNKIVKSYDGYFTQVTFNTNPAPISFDKNSTNNNYLFYLNTALGVWIFNDIDKFNELVKSFGYIYHDEHAVDVTEKAEGYDITLSLNFIKFIIKCRLPFFEQQQYSYIRETVNNLEFNRMRGDTISLNVSTRNGLKSFDITKAILDCMSKKSIANYSELMLPRSAYSPDNIIMDSFLFRTKSEFNYVISQNGEIIKIINSKDITDSNFAYRDIYSKAKEILNAAQSQCIVETIDFASIKHPKLANLLKSIDKVKSVRDTGGIIMINLDDKSSIGIRSWDYTLGLLSIN